MSDVSAASAVLAKQSLATLEKHYPGWGWSVEVDDVQGTMVVRVGRIATGKWGFMLHIKKVDPEGRAVMRAGGEILERYRMHRRGYRPGDSRLILRDQRGLAVADG